MKRPSGVPTPRRPEDGAGGSPRRPAEDATETPAVPRLTRPAAKPAEPEEQREPETPREADTTPAAVNADTGGGTTASDWIAQAVARARQAGSTTSAPGETTTEDLSADLAATEEIGTRSRSAAASGPSTSSRSAVTGSAAGSAADSATVGPAVSEAAFSAQPDPENAARVAREAKRERKRFERQEVRRFTVRTRRRRRAWLIAVGSVVGVALIATLLSYTPILSVRKIDVRGTDRLSGSALEHELASQLGTPFPLVDQSAIKAVLTEFPLIESYRVESSPPSTLIVRIVERTPVGVVATNAGYELVDAAGVVIDRTGERPAGYPEITADRTASMDAFRAAAAVLRSMPEELRARVSSIGATTRDDVTFGLTDSETTVLWGDAADGVIKAKLLEALMKAQPEAKRINVTSAEIGVVG
ncbi:FtsQ-type POTRA domain-containing protein [Mycetocola tolaasinivorans]|uniref:FtsQ-type POTRA domain-containing protein n=1 Tax=Mycetocola tolaasinivorans TaxID=76635 RepID=A0A3L7AEE0_9MICO|nr:FtsQ-type POTRA domain-containing protein [Mycetocola tolaasinivorans]RLP78068.1 FtsQ-type POTRA domain-containing protein [Mycetocola tolaasinivorans]